MSTKYPQGVITATPPFQSTTAQSYSGVWTLEQLGKNYFYYQQPVAKSLRFRSSASAYLSRTPSTGGNQTTWTWSAWVKRGLVASTCTLYGAVSGSVECNLYFDSSGVLRFYNYGPSAYNFDLTTTPVYRDPSSWYHISLAYDSTQGTPSNRIKLYVNGVQVTSFSTETYPSQNYAGVINSSSAQKIGSWFNGTSFFDGYLAEVNFIDGQALDASYFGQLSTITGVWSPKKYVGSYGGNGFYLPFTDATSTTTLGYDSSGNGNNWTTNNISLTSGSTYDSMWDSPTSYDNGVNGVGNYAVLNPLIRSYNGNPTFSNANLTIAPNLGNYQTAYSTLNVTSGKWYGEVLVTGTPNSANMIGVSSLTEISYITNNVASLVGVTSTGYGYYIHNGNKYTNATSTAYGSAVASGDVVSVALDLDNGKIWFAKNGTWQASGDPVAGTNAAFTGIVGSNGFSFGATVYNGGVSSFSANFGQRPFAYTPPTGFKALNTQNLPAVSIANGANHMAASLFTGNNQPNESVLNSYNSVGFQPDFVWMKSRSNSQSNYLVDSVRGGSSLLRSDTTGAESTGSVWIQSFDASGFTATNNVLSNGYTYVGWSWKAGGTAVTNTAGSITSQVSANTTAGFSVIKYTTSGGGAYTVGHGLGVKPDFIILKRTNVADNWYVYHTSIGSNFLQLNNTNAQASTSQWNGTNASVISWSDGGTGSGDVAYCFAAIAGYSAFGSYTGNGSTDGPFVYCGFRPRWVLLKRTDTTANWQLSDTSRTPSNVVGQFLQPNLSNAEATATVHDILSNGFKLRSADVTFNASGGTYIYAAFAENPFKYSLAR